MNCEYFQGLLHLNRTGEISSGEAELLRQHLRICEKCVLEQRRIDQAEALMNQLRATLPVPASAAKLTADIMREVRLSASEASATSLIDGALNFFSRPVVRVASMALTCMAVGLFTYQYLTMLNDIHNLERSATETTHNPLSTGALYSVETHNSQDLARLSKDLQKLLPSDEYTVSDSQILIRESSVASFLSSNGLQSITTTVASSLLHMEKSRLDRIVDYATKNATAIVNREH